MNSADSIIRIYAESMNLSPDDPTTIDKVIESLALGTSFSDDDSNLLRTVIGEKLYKGKNPHVMLILYDILSGSQENLAYGIQGFETFERNPKKILGLENPDRLVEYAILTTVDLEELIQLEETLLFEGELYNSPHIDVFINNFMLNHPNKRLAKSLLMVANEIAYRLRDVDPTKDIPDGMSLKEFNDTIMKKWWVRVDAHRAILLAYQAMENAMEVKKNGFSEETLKAFEIYDSLMGGEYERARVGTELMEAYFKRKYGTDKPSTGEVPDSLKADHDFASQLWFARTPFDNHLRSRYFGVKKSPWNDQGQADSPESEQEGFGDQTPPPTYTWSQVANELEILGITRDMSYEQARAVFIEGIKRRRGVFNNPKVDTPEHRTASLEAANYINSWKRVETLYAKKIL